MAFQVQVFPLLVRKQAKTWPEKRARTTRWFTLTDALGAVDDDSLQELLVSFAATEKAKKALLTANRQNRDKA